MKCCRGQRRVRPEKWALDQSCSDSFYSVSPGQELDKRLTNQVGPGTGERGLITKGNQEVGW